MSGAVVPVRLPARRSPSSGPGFGPGSGDVADPMVARVVAMLESMGGGAVADAAPDGRPVGGRKVTGRRAYRLGFIRLVFYPLDPLIVPAVAWQPERETIPRTALLPMGRHVRAAMGAAAETVAAAIVGHSTADKELVVRTGRALWPEAARCLGAASVAGWDATGLGAPMYQDLSERVAALLAGAPELETLCEGSEIGLRPATAETVAGLLGRVAQQHAAALPMMLTLLLDRLPSAVGLLPEARSGQVGVAIQAALDRAADHLLGQLEQVAGGTEARIAAGSLAEASAEANRVAALLTHLDARNTKAQRRDRLRGVRRQLNAGCKARFVSGLQHELLAPLCRAGAALAPADVAALEATSRGLRMLEAAARAVGGGATYDLLLGKTAEAIQKSTMRDRLTPMDQVRLVEILAGPDAALAMLEPI